MKNMFDDGLSTSKNEVYDDKTGTKLDISQHKRLDIGESLKFVQEAAVVMLNASRPTLAQYSIQMALFDVCRYTGWTPLEVAMAQELYASQINGIVSNATQPK